MESVPSRKSIRIQKYDYSTAGAYFVTLCTDHRKNVLGTVVGGGVLDAPRVNLSPYGTFVENALLSIDKTYDDISIDKYVIMPNHVHLIVVLLPKDGPSRTPALKKSSTDLVS